MSRPGRRWTNWRRRYLTDQSVTLAYLDQRHTRENAGEATKTKGIELEVVKHTETKRGFILLPRRWVAE